MNVPMLIGTSGPAYDERGRVLQGSAVKAEGQGDLVQILLVGEGIRPPLADGSPDPANELVAETQIGNMTSTARNDSGAFAYDLTDQYAAVFGKQLFVRFFNAPTLTQASFYGDSASVAADSDRVLLDAPKVENELYPLDGDGDRLSDSWEMSYGTDQLLMDTDGDGMTDFEEVRTGSDPLDRASVFQVGAHGDHSSGLKLYWPSSVGVEYVVQQAETLGSHAEWTTVKTVEGQVGQTSVDLPNNGAQRGYYRVSVAL
jgi:hypothetical protein